MAEATVSCKELNDRHALAGTLHFAAILGHLERNPAEVARWSRISLSCQHVTILRFGLLEQRFLVVGRRPSDNTASIARIEDGIRDYRASGTMLRMPHYLALKAEALYLADRNSEALEAIAQAEAVVERFEERGSSAELCRLRGVLLAALDAEETQIEASFCKAISIAREQSRYRKRAEGSHAEYRRQKASATTGRGFRLSLC
jgi:hypothetical protein